MKPFSAEYLRIGTGGRWETDFKGIANGFCYDTRKLKGGEIFLALKTEKADGHAYLKEAYEQGACGAIVERADGAVPMPQLVVKDVLAAFQKLAQYHRRNFKGIAYGITGSCGKTTSKDWLTELVGAKETCATIINENNLLGVPMTLMRMDDRLHKQAVIEAGMNIKGEMEALSRMIEPDITVIMNVYPVHLEWVGEVEDIAYEKAFLARFTRKDGKIIIPYACLEYEAFRGLLDKRLIVLMNKDEVDSIKEGLKEDQICYSRIERKSKEKVILELDYKGKKEIYDVPFMSKGRLNNAALVILTVREGGIQPEMIQERIQGWKMAEFRGEWLRHEGQTYFIDCYNANPVAMMDAVEYFKEMAMNENRRLYVLGCMGELGARTKEYHYGTGKELRIAKNDHVFVIGKDAESFAFGIRDSGVDENQILCFNHKEEARERVQAFKGSIFLKGSKKYRLWELLPKLNEKENKQPCLVI